MSIEPITRLQRFLRVLADSSADMPEPLRNLEKCCCYACGHLDTRPELHTTLEKLIASVRDKSIVPPKPNTRLEKYVAAMAGVWDDELPEPITREDKILFEAVSGEDVTLSGNPLILENCIGGKALKALHVYGKSTQDGTPSPDNPVPTVSAGDGGSVAVQVTGRNLLNIPDGSRTIRGVTITSKNGLISISGTATDTGYAYLDITPFIVSDTVFFSSSLAEPRASLVSNKWQQIITQGISKKMSDTVVRICFTVMKGRTYNLTGVSLQLELGTTATAYEPYREQLLTLPTPNGLRGIPVTSGGNYTDPTGQQWVCDEVDFARGVRVQRVKVKELSPDDKWTYQKLDGGNNNYQERLDDTVSAKAGWPCICNILPFKNVMWNDSVANLPKIYAYAKEITASFPPSSEYSSLEAFKQLLTNVKSVIYYALATPIETPLTDAEIAAYKSLTTYAPTTVVQAADGAGLEATYKCNVRKAEKTINDLYAELTAELEA